MEDFLYAYNQPKKFGKYDLILDGKIIANEVVYKVLTEDNEIENINLVDKVKELESKLQTHFTFETVTELPSEGKETVIYLVPNDEGSGDKDSYNEYMWVKEKGEFELIGSGTYAQQQADLDAEVKRATAKENDLTDNLAKEVTDRTDADTALDDKISAEVKRATEAEEVLTDNLAKEIEDRTDADTLIRETVTSITGYPFEKITGDTKSISDELKQRVPYTLYEDVNVVGNVKNVIKLDIPELPNEAMYCPQGLIMGGSAQAAGLVTRGICGVATPDDDGSCTKENLYINYDGTTTYSQYRQLVIQAGVIGEHYGHNLYQFAAARGDAVKGYVDEKIGTETDAREALQEEVIALKSQVNMLEIKIDFLEGKNISEKIETNNIEEALVDSFTQPITLNNVVISSPQNLALDKENEVEVSIGSITIDGMTYDGDVQTIVGGDRFPISDKGTIFINKLGQFGEKDDDGNITKNVIKCKVNVRGNDVDGKEVNVISGVVSITLNGDYKKVETSLYSYLSVLPDGYRRVQYLESTGIQYIDTGITEYFSLTQTISAVDGQQAIVGMVRGSGVTMNYWGVHETGQVYLGGAGSLGLYANEPTSITYELTPEFLYFGQTGNLRKREVTASKPSLLILGYDNHQTNCFRLHSAQVSVNNVLVRNFIPCLDTTGTPCMYDTVIRKPFHNFGSEDDDFLTDRTLPDGYTELEYLESTGTQWIDTGVKLSSESEVRCEWETTEDYSDLDNKHTKVVYGSEESTTVRFALYSIQSTRMRFDCPTFIWAEKPIKGARYKTEHSQTKGVYVNGGKIGDFQSKDFVCTINAHLFNRAGNYQFTGRIYNFSIRRNGVLQADYQPCLDDQGKPCMYDFVTNTPFYNNNTTGDDFVYVLPETGTFALRRQDLTSMGSLSKYGLRRIHRLPFNFDGDMEKFISENNIKPIVKTEMPNDGKYYVPQWTQDDEIITLEWIESEPTIDEITN